MSALGAPRRRRAADTAETKRAAEILKEQGVPLLIHQPNYSMLDRWIENGLLDVLEETTLRISTIDS